MTYIQPIYKTIKTTEKYLIDNYNFKKSECGATLRFPIYKYKNKPLIFCEMIFDKDEYQIYIRVFDNNGNTYNYNIEEYGKSKVIEKINKEITKKINELIDGEIIC